MLIIWILLLDAVDSVNSPDRDVSKPLLMPICDVVRSNSHGQVSACGKLESGAVRSGSKIMVMPSGEQELCGLSGLHHCKAGDNVAIALQGIDANQLEFHVHHAKEAATVVKLAAMLDPKTGKPTKKSPRCLTAKQSAMLEDTVSPDFTKFGLGHRFDR
ncbi:unnamed protein product [Brassica oleracea]